ncbi:hypothetical protein BJ165DRAFT_1400541 [Panaeolus papilionaceus]|nr:hypothetical protein BJ165DRAFT_1400541 [Panaeolus papilionaceus]
MLFRIAQGLCVLSSLLLASQETVALDNPSPISPYLSNVKTKFQEAGVIVDSLGIKFGPKALLDIIWPAPDGVSHPIRFYPGGHLTDNNTIPLPIFKAIGLTDNNTGPFVVITVDPDSPTPDSPFLRPICHFISGDFYFDASDSLLKNRMEAISGWIRPAPVQHLVNIDYLQVQKARRIDFLSKKKRRQQDSNLRPQRGTDDWRHSYSNLSL